MHLSRQKLGEALSKASQAQDNHLRALLLAFISSHFLHTSPDEAERMLLTCETLCAGLGAQARKSDSDLPLPEKTKLSTGRVGNAPLRLWVGERFLGTLG